MIVDEEVYLSHYGKKGMKWGVRKAAFVSTQESDYGDKTRLKRIVGPSRSERNAAASRHKERLRTVKGAKKSGNALSPTEKKKLGSPRDIARDGKWAHQVPRGTRLVAALLLSPTILAVAVGADHGVGSAEVSRILAAKGSALPPIPPRKRG